MNKELFKVNFLLICNCIIYLMVKEIMNDLGQVIIYKTQDNKNKIEVKLVDNNVWLSLDQLVLLYNSSKSNISEHIKHILEDGELQENPTVRKFRTVQKEGNREVSRDITYYNLDMIIAIGFRVRSNIGTSFRVWATQTLNEYMIKGFVLNDNLLKEAGGGRYFKELLSRIRDIRSSEKVFWRQVLDIYATSVDYDPKAEVSYEFFKTVQNKIHYAVHGHTAAEIIEERAEADKDFMGLTSFSGDYPLLEDAYIAKNYLSKDELEVLNRIVSLYLDFAELQALEEKPMTMKDYANQLDYFLSMTKKELLEGKGSISHEEAIKHARQEYEKFRVRLVNNPTANEKHYIESINELLTISSKNKNEK